MGAGAWAGNTRRGCAVTQVGNLGASYSDKVEWGCEETDL